MRRRGNVSVRRTSAADRTAWGSATPKQRAYLGELARRFAPNVDESTTLRRFGAPDDMRSLSMAGASHIIDALKARVSGDRVPTLRDPGEDAADRWAESQVGL